MGITDKELRKMNLKQFMALMARHEIQQEIENSRVATLCLAIFRAAGNRKVKHSDFMPKKPKQAQTPEEMAAFCKNLVVKMGGEIKCN